MKSWYKSKTLWVNVLSLAALAIQTKTGFVVSPEIQSAVLGGLNIVLRGFTDTALTS